MIQHRHVVAGEPVVIRVPEIEEFRSVPGFPGYFVNRLGQVVGRRGGVLRPGRGARGSRSVVLYLDGDPVTRQLHHVVLESWVGDRPPGTEGSHINGDAGDNEVSNLTWETHSQNMKRRTAHGNHPTGDGASNRTLNSGQVAEIRRLFTGKRGELTALGKRFGVCRTQIRHIVDGKSWKETYEDPQV